MKNWKVIAFKLHCLVSKSLKDFSWLRLCWKKQSVLNIYSTQSWAGAFLNSELNALQKQEGQIISFAKTYLRKEKWKPIRIVVMPF